jgi:hypothetical protein
MRNLAANEETYHVAASGDPGKGGSLRGLHTRTFFKGMNNVDIKI